jgi:hypothetical protein
LSFRERVAHKLPSIPWKIPGSEDPIYLIESLELRQYFGLLIGEIAASHHWTAEKVVAIFKDWKFLALRS